MEFFHTSHNIFATFSMEHLLVLLAYTAFAFCMYRYADVYLSKSGKRRLGLFVSVMPLLTLLVRMYVIHLFEGFSYLEDLPLYICRFACFLLPILFLTNSKKLFGVLYFWIMAGTINAVITPDLKYGLPHYESIFYWLIHCGLIMSILYGVFVHKWRPAKSDIWSAFWWANLFLVGVHLVNTFLQSNYSYTMHKPPKGSALDFFGPWPVYLLTGQFIALLLFFFFYAPFYWAAKKTRNCKQYS